MTTKDPPVARPTVRIHSLDVVRGLAVLGILAVNAAAFALPLHAEFDPSQVSFAQGDGAVLAQWFVDVFFSQKFVTLFSMLFGVSIFLIGGERSDHGAERRLKRRLAWLAVFGVLHGALLWYGDILLLYAWTGLFMMRLRFWPARKLILVGGSLVLILGTVQALIGLASAGAGNFLGGLDEDTSANAVANALAAYHSGWPAGLIENLKAWGLVQAASLFLFVFPTLFLMMLGLGLFKAGFFHGRLPNKLYYGLIAAGAVLASVLGVLTWIELSAGPEVEATGGWAAAVLSFPVFISLAYASGLILLTRNGVVWVRKRLAPVGQMAFTNYLTQTLIMASLFYLPFGPRLMGQVDYPGQWAVVIAVWGAQLIWSPLWLKHFRMGPFEWVWRCLTQAQNLPLRRV